MAVADLEAPPLNERGQIDLVSPKRGLTVLLTGESVQYLPNGGQRKLADGMSIRFRDSRASIGPAEWELLIKHPAWTGDGEPRLVYLEDQHAIMATGGVIISEGPQSASAGHKQPPPIVGWDRMTDVEISRAVRGGRVPAPVDAILYERLNRNRPGVILLLAAAVGGGDLPTATQMRSAERKAAQARGDAGEPEPAPPEPDPAAEADLALADPDEQLRRAIDEASGHVEVAPDESQPAPEEVL